MFRVLDRETNQSRTTLDAQTRDELEALFRAAGRDGRLVCPHCMAPVLFRYSEIYMPHFSHKSLGACPFSSESLPVIRARAALYLLLKERFQSQVEIEYVVPGLKLSRPVDCWVRSKENIFAYWLLEKGVRGRIAAIELRDMLKTTGANLHFLFLVQVLRPVEGG
jgi:competence CoiA-like predicted nuclease